MPYPKPDVVHMKFMWKLQLTTKNVMNVFGNESEAVIFYQDLSWVSITSDWSYTSDLLPL